MSALPSPAYGDAGAVAPRGSRQRGARPTIVDRLRVAARHDALDAALAAGADRIRQPQLALRAAQLERPRHRRVLARTLRGVVDEATGSRPPARATAIVIARRHLLAGADDVLALADRLDSAQPAHATGIAIAQRLITDALSPLYMPSERDMLGALSRRAIAEMDDPAGRSSR